MTLKVINLAAGPSAGKTTNALNLAGEMKKMRLNVAYVPEFPLELVQQQRWLALEDQLYIFGEQHHRLYSVRKDFDWAVTDGPLWMQLYYLRKANVRFEGDRNFEYWKLTLSDLIMQTSEMYNNINYFVDRGDRKFLQAGRVQNEEESKAIDGELLKLAADLDLEYKIIKDEAEVLIDLRERKLL